MPILGADIQTNEQVELTEEARRQGVYIIGTTGTGKTTLLQNIAFQDMADSTKPALIVLDPHGDFVDELLERVPDNRRDGTILFAPGDRDQIAQPLGLNLLACDRSDPRARRLVASTVVDTLHKLFAYSWGPRMEDLLRHSILTLMETPNTTFLDLLLLLASEEHRTRYTKDLTDPVLRHFWQQQFAQYSARDKLEVASSSLNKIGRFLVDPLMCNIIAQAQNAFSLRSVMDEGKILLVNLSKGDLGEDNSRLLGAVLVNLVLIAALQRRETPVAKRRRVHLIVDEFQNFATESFATLQSEARKYAIDLIVAHQYRDQLDELNRGSTLNVANLIVMRISGKDSFELASQFDNTPPPPERRLQPLYRPDGHSAQGEQLFITHESPEGTGTVYHEVEQPRRPYSDVQAETANRQTILHNHRAMCRLVSGGALVERVIKTYPPQGRRKSERASEIRNQSKALGQPKERVEKQIADLIGENLTFEYASGFEATDD